MRVLVVEDDEQSAASMSMQVHKWGHEVRVALDAPAALRAAEDCLPDVVLLDIGLLGTSGYTVARGIGELPGDKKSFLIAISGHGQVANGQHSTEAGIRLQAIIM